jgi:hypothetical protein
MMGTTQLRLQSKLVIVILILHTFMLMKLRLEKLLMRKLVPVKSKETKFSYVQSYGIFIMIQNMSKLHVASH